MPYKNIVFVKLEKRLLNDHRWFTMSDKAQLLYIKLLLGAAETYDKLPTNSQTLRTLLRISWRKECFDSALEEILNNFPRIKKVGNYYQIEEFETKTNYIRANPSDAQVVPKVDVDKEKDKDKDINKQKKKLNPIDEEKFNLFWDKYKKKTGKENSIKQWNKLTEEERLKVIAIVDAYVNYKPDPQYRKDPERFLGNKIFNDEILTEKKIVNKSFESPIMNELYGK